MASDIIQIVWLSLEVIERSKHSRLEVILFDLVYKSVYVNVS